MSNKVLIFGIDIFTGGYLKEKLRLNDFDVVGTTLNSNHSYYCDITSFKCSVCSDNSLMGICVILVLSLFA